MTDQLKLQQSISKVRFLIYDGQTITIDDQQAASIIAYLSDNDYIDSKG